MNLQSYGLADRLLREGNRMYLAVTSIPLSAVLFINQPTRLSTTQALPEALK